MAMFILSCKYVTKENTVERKEVARVYDLYLYEDDLAEIIPSGTAEEDSVLMARNYINNWVRQHVVLHKAENNLSDREKQVEKQLSEYRNSLIRHIYETELIRQRLDTNVSEEEIETYYKNNPRNFELRDNIIKAIYIKTKSNAPKLNKLRQWYKSNDNKDRMALEEYCHQFAIDFNLDDDSWVLFDELLKKVPIKTYDKEEFLKNNRYIEITDSNETYFINIKGFMIKQSLSPLSFEKDNIRAIIINRRKLELVKEMEKAAFDQALKNNDFEIYDTKAK